MEASINRSETRPGRRLLLELCAALAALPLLAFAHQAMGDSPGAASPDTAVETMVVTGTRLAGSMDSLPSFVTIIDDEQLRARQDESVLELLRSLAGVHVTQYGGRGGASSVFIRGSEPNFTVVLLDGVKVNDPNNSRGGAFDFSTLNLAEIERIEIVRGAQSSIYGSDALSGIINIITRRSSDDLSGSAEVELGEDGFRRGSVALSGPIGTDTGFALSLTGSDDGTAIDGSQFTNYTVTGRLTSSIGDRASWDVAARYADSEAEAFPEDSGGPELAVLPSVDQRDQRQWSVTGNLRYRLTERVTWFLNAGFAEHEERFVSPGIAPGVRSGVPPNSTDSTFQRLNVTTNVQLELSDGVVATVGLDQVNEEGKSAGLLELFPGFALPTDFSLKRDTTGAFGEVRYQPGNGLLLAASVRHDRPDGYGSETTQNMAAQYQFGSTRAFVSWGKGFKLPSFFALGHALVGNPDLRPETSDNWEAGVTRSLLDGRAGFTLAVFRNRFEDLIDFDFELFTNVNRARVINRGFELVSTSRPTARLELSAHVTHVDIDVNGEDTTLRQRPEWRGGVNLVWQVTPTVAFDVDWLHVGSSFDSAVPTGGMTLKGYDRVDAKLAWTPTDRVRIWIAVDNVFDADYQEALGFPAIGLRARAGVRYRI